MFFNTERGTSFRTFEGLGQLGELDRGLGGGGEERGKGEGDRGGPGEVGM